jgi:hypothetical protein
VGLSGIAHSNVLACSSRLRLVGQCNRPGRDTYARRVGSSVHEGHGLLNGETGRDVARAQVERECHAAPAIGVMSWTALTFGTIASFPRSYAAKDPWKSQCTVSTGR